jgi:hypothetical protein
MERIAFRSISHGASIVDIVPDNGKLSSDAGTSPHRGDRMRMRGFHPRAADAGNAARLVS